MNQKPICYSYHWKDIHNICIAVHCCCSEDCNFYSNQLGNSIRDNIKDKNSEFCYEYSLFIKFSLCSIDMCLWWFHAHKYNTKLNICVCLNLGKDVFALQKMIIWVTFQQYTEFQHPLLRGSGLEVHGLQVCSAYPNFETILGSS